MTAEQTFSIQGRNAGPNRASEAARPEQGETAGHHNAGVAPSSFRSTCRSETQRVRQAAHGAEGGAPGKGRPPGEGQKHSGQYAAGGPGKLRGRPSAGVAWGAGIAPRSWSWALGSGLPAPCDYAVLAGLPASCMPQVLGSQSSPNALGLQPSQVVILAGSLT